MISTVLAILCFCSFCTIAAAAFQSAYVHHTAAAPFSGHSSSILSAKKQGSDGDDVVALVHSHHLLDHKPDNMILKGGKYKLRGVGCLGRPGVALCIGPEKSINKFRSKLESAMPQKKFGVMGIDIATIPTEELTKLDGFEEASLGELRAVLASLGHEDKFFTLTGISFDCS